MCHLFSLIVWSKRGSADRPRCAVIIITGVHVDDQLGGGGEVFQRTVFEFKREFDFGAWGVGATRFKGRQLTQMANYEIMIVSKSDKAKPEWLRSAKEMTRYRGGLWKRWMAG